MGINRKFGSNYCFVLHGLRLAFYRLLDVTDADRLIFKAGAIRLFWSSTAICD
jgi:hypothetical protein